MRVDKQKHGAASVNKPKLKPGDTGGADVVVGTITDVVLVPASGEFSERFKFTFAEFPDRHHYLRPEEVDIMVDKCGDNTDEWLDQRIPLIKTLAPNPSKHDEETEVYRIALAERWKKLLAEYDSQSGAKRSRGRK